MRSGIATKIISETPPHISQMVQQYGAEKVRVGKDSQVKLRIRYNSVKKRFEYRWQSVLMLPGLPSRPGNTVIWFELQTF